MDENNQQNNQLNGNLQPNQLEQTPMQQQPQMNVQQPMQQQFSQPQVNQQAAQPNYNNYNNVAQTPKKKGKGGLIVAIVILLVLLIAIAGGIIFFFVIYQNPVQVYKKLVGSAIDSYSAALDVEEYNTIKSTIELSADVAIEGIDSNIADLINNIDISLNAQLDIKNQKVLANIGADYNKNDLLNAQVYASVKDEKSYVYLKDFFDKYIEVDMDSDVYDSIKETLENEKEIAKKKNDLKNILQIVKNEITGTIKKEYCSKEKVKIIVNGKEINATKNIIKMNGKQLTSEIKTIMNNLKENKDFLACFEDNEEIKESIEEAIDKLDYESIDEEFTIEVHLYMTGFINQQIAKFEIIAKNDEQNVELNITGIEENNYEISLKQEGEEIFKGFIINENEEKTVVSVKIPELGNITLTVKYNQKFNEKIDSVDTSNSVKMDELTQEDQSKMLTNLQNSELYKIISKFSDSNDIEIPNITTNEDLEFENNIEKEDEDTNTSNTNTSELQENQIITYDEKTKVTFGVPLEYNLNRLSNNYVSLKKDGVNITVSSSYAKQSEYYDSLVKQKQAYANGTYDNTYSKCKNVNLSSKESITVGTNTFNMATFSYDNVSTSTGNSTTYKSKYVWLQVSEKYVFELRITDNNDKVTDADLQQILNITFEDVK